MDEVKRKTIATLVQSCVSELGNHFPPPKSSMGLAQRVLFEIFQSPTADLLAPDKLSVFRASPPFSQLVEFVMSDGELCAAIWNQDYTFKNSSDRDAFQRVAEVYLFRAMAAIHHSRSVKADEIDAFIDFLQLTEVEREVVVPLDRLDLEDRLYDLGDFGLLTLEGATTNEGDREQLFRQKHCLLRFKAKTKTYFGVEKFPFAEAIRNRVAAVRMAANPFASFNHFGISHIHPWEDRLRDEVFSDRFYGHATRVISPSTENLVTISQPMTREMLKLYDICRAQKWKQISPWRLALNRLDDAIFKIESGSTDALLDIVIGIESVLVEPQSTQESTHKVAVRAARFLSTDTQRRFGLFKTVKELYSLRSKIAHGKSLGIDDHSVKLLEEGVRLVTDVLKKMLETGLTELDLSRIDLE